MTTECERAEDAARRFAREAIHLRQTLREQWVWEWDRALPEDPWDDPPADWWPQESTPSWIEDPHGSEVWVVTWTT